MKTRSPATIRPLGRAALACAVLAASGCDRDRAVEAEPAPPGPRHLELSGKLVRMGSDDAFAGPDEAPAWIRMGHDVWMDSTEMTQEEYLALVGTNPSAVQGLRLPVTNVSWFDAVLAANARSVRDGLDTVYAYALVRRDPAGAAWDLPGLVVRLDRNGWRLPTEVEWEAAASAGSSSAWSWGGIADSAQARRFAWYEANARGVLHEVATLAPNAWGLHDMAGNAMEWVNDWKGRFPRDTVDDYAGPEAPGDVAEAPLKGGAYAYGLAQLRPSSRAATYPAYRSSKAEYVGFRLARGAFVARYTSNTGGVVWTPPVSLVRTDVASLVGSWQARLVFVNRANGRGTLSWVDYGEANPVVRSLPDRDPVFHPAISPDGRWVAWSTVLEGSVQPGRIKARRLAKDDTTVLDLGEGSIPRWWIDGTDTFLVRASALDDLSPDWASTTTTARLWSKGALSGADRIWSADGSFHDGRSGPYLYTGFRRLRQHDLRGGTRRTLFAAPANGKLAGDTSQVCNVSAAPDSTGRVLFLDFGFTGVSGVVGRPYGIHEVAFVADSTGRVVRTIEAPAGEAQWEHLEWSNDPHWAVSGAIDRTGAYRNLYLVSMGTGSATRIASGLELWQPSLWIGTPTGAEPGIDLDSVFQYFRPRAGSDLDGFGSNLLRFWLAKDSLEVALVGSSQLDRFWPGGFPNHRVLSMSWAAGVHSDYDRVIRRYLLPHAPRLKIVVISLMPGWFFPHEGNWPSSRWDGGFSATWGHRYDSSHGYWEEGLPTGFASLVRERMRSQGAVASPPLDTLGSSDGWGSGTPATHPALSEDTTQASYRDGMARMESLLATLTARGIHVVLLHAPECPAYRDGDQAGFWGPSWPTFHRIMDRARAWERADPRIHLYDANRDGEHDYTFEEFGNENHLAGKGILKLSARLDSVFTTIVPVP